jgi:hypothetical protein
MSWGNERLIGCNCHQPCTPSNRPFIPPCCEVRNTHKPHDTDKYANYMCSICGFAKRKNETGHGIVFLTGYCICGEVKEPVAIWMRSCREVCAGDSFCDGGDWVWLQPKPTDCSEDKWVQRGSGWVSLPDALIEKWKKKWPSLGIDSAKKENLCNNGWLCKPAVQVSSNVSHQKY